MPTDSKDTTEEAAQGNLKWQEKVKQLQEEKRLREEKNSQTAAKPAWVEKIEKMKKEAEPEEQSSDLGFDIEAFRSEQERQEKIRLGNRVNITRNGMGAEIILVPKEDGTSYTPDDIKDILLVAGVKQGLLTEEIEALCKNEQYFVPVTVAAGKEVKNGTDGYFTYHFNSEINKKPKENPDGSVDYYSVQMFVTVEKNELLATYTPSTAGEFGYTVSGQLLVPQKGKSLPRHKGKGFFTDEEQTEYRASFSGKVDLKNGDMEVSRLVVITGNLDMTVGNINFDGDVTVGGEVATGMTISVTGNVEISGHVGGATIKAGGDVILKSGMQGEHLGVVIAGGDISGRFFEGVNLTAGGSIKANYLFMCRSEAEGSIVISGSKGAIVGGEAVALRNIEAHNIGNAASAHTLVKIGFSEKYIDQYNKLNKKIEKIRNELNVFEKAIRDYTSGDPRKAGISEDMFAKINQANDIRRAELEASLAERHTLLELLASVKNNSIKVKTRTYDGSVIQIDTTILRVKEVMGFGEFIREGDKIILKK